MMHDEMVSMPSLFKGPSMDSLFVSVARALLDRGEVRETRGTKSLELSDAWLVLTDPSRSVVTLKERRLSQKYLHAEMLWYESGSLEVRDIAEHSSFWASLADTNGTVNSNYGFLALKEKHSGKSQMEWCVDRLRQDPETRQAIINYNQPRHKYPGNKDFVCTISQQFVLRNGRLDTVVLMRSNDLIYGLSYDAPWFASMLARVAAASGLEMGSYHHYASSLHVYERHFGMLRKIAEVGGPFEPRRPEL